MTEPKRTITEPINILDTSFFLGEIEEVAKKLLQLKNKWSRKDKYPDETLQILCNGDYDNSYYGLGRIRTETDEEYNKRIEINKKDVLNKLKKAQQQQEKLAKTIRDLESTLKS